MADAKLTALTEITSTSGDEVFYVVDDDDGTPVSRKITVENLITAMTATEATARAAADTTLDDKIDLRTQIPMLTAKTAAFTVDSTMLYSCQLINRSAGNFNITVPTPASIGAVAGDWIQFYTYGTSQGTFVADTAPTPDVVVNSYGGALKTLGQYTFSQLYVIDASSSGTWALTGQITT